MIKLVLYVSITFEITSHNSDEVIFMMNLKKTVARNKGCTCVMMTALGAAMGCLAAKLVIKHCSCADKLAYKAQRALRSFKA